MANPKAWIAIAAVFASARLAADASLDAAAKVAVLSAMIVLINTSWLAIGASLAPLLRDPRRSRAVNVTLAVVLVADRRAHARPLDGWFHGAVMS